MRERVWRSTLVKVRRVQCNCFVKSTTSFQSVVIIGLIYSSLKNIKNQIKSQQTKKPNHKQPHTHNTWVQKKEGFPFDNFKLLLKRVRKVGANAPHHLLPHPAAEMVPPFWGYCCVSPTSRETGMLAQATQVHAEVGSRRWEWNPFLGQAGVCVEELLWPRLAEAQKQQGQKHRQMSRMACLNW